MAVTLASPAGKTAAATSVEDLLRHEQLRLVYDYLPVSQLVAVINGIVLVAVQSLVIATPVLVAWLYALCVVTLFRIMGGIAFRRSRP